jgi:hypothetical protein
LHGEQVERHFVDLAFYEVNLRLALENHVTTLQVTVDVGLAGTVYRLLRQSAHAE